MNEYAKPMTGHDPIFRTVTVSALDEAIKRLRDDHDLLMADRNRVMSGGAAWKLINDEIERLDRTILSLARGA